MTWLAIGLATLFAVTIGVAVGITIMLVVGGVKLGQAATLAARGLKAESLVAKAAHVQARAPGITLN